MRRTALTETAVVLTAIAVVAAALWATRGMAPETRQFPLLIGVVLLVLLIAEFIVILRRPPGAAEKRVMDLRIGADIDPRELVRRTARFAVWMLGLFLAVYFLGFRIGGTAALFLYIRFGFHERWVVAGAISLAVLGVLMIAVEVLQTPVHRGVLF